MDAGEIRSLAIKASEYYLDFLQQNQKGIERFPILSIKEIDKASKLFAFKIRGKLFSTDAVILADKTTNREYLTGVDFDVDEYDFEKAILIVRISSDACLASIGGDLEIRVDLRFLVRNVMNFFDTKGHSLAFPANPPLDAQTISLAPHKSDISQEQAISSALSASYLYVWGPPGSGKTKVVLAILSKLLVRDGYRLAIFAPTNNAVELALAAVLEAAGRQILKPKETLRVGIPSSHFSQSYPEACEVKGLAARLRELTEKLERLKIMLEFRKGEGILTSLTKIYRMIEKYEAEKKILEEMITGLSRVYDELGEKRREKNSFFGRVKHYFAGSSTELDGQIARLETESQVLQLDSSEHKALAQAILNEIASSSTGSDKVDAMISAVSLEEPGAVQRLWEQQEKIRSYLLQKAHISDAYSGVSDVDLQHEMRKAENELQTLEQNKITERVKAAKVIGMTLDSYLSRFSGETLNVDRVLIDEAGYASIIKTLPLLRGIPLTLFGDHMQLPPVSELSDDGPATQDELEYRSLWSQPGIYAPFMLKENRTSFFQIVQGDTWPDSHESYMATLTTTHRFGHELAELLNDEIYKYGLKSANPERHLQIHYINCRPHPDDVPQTRVANSEVIAAFDLSRTLDTLDYAIITPYKNQEAVLRDAIPEASEGMRIMTIHKSQGREWETVIISVVDGSHNSPWFTDSRLRVSRGAKVLNTALSRAKTRLIVLCQTDYWKRASRSNQLLFKLLAKATPYRGT